MRKQWSLVIAVLALVIVASSLALAGCGGSKGSGKSTSPPASSSASTGGVTSQTLGVPVYPGTRADEAFAGVFKMTTTDSFDKVIEFYEKELPDATFSEIKIDTGRGASFVVDKSDFNGNISVEENLPGSGQVTITVSRFKTK
ncbi:MAG: hypothetical protein ACYC99_11185 [Candidatus Geothermincolia bacterium]